MMISKRLFDIAFSVAVLVVASPVMAVAAIAIACSSSGPILYRARRVGIGGRPFLLYKFRTMHHRRTDEGSVITAASDNRVFPVGELLRKLKVDELPQLVNVIKGDMSIVGPRPEDPSIVEANYGPDEWATLDVRPGLTSPGSIYYYTCLEQTLVGEDAENIYVERVMRPKLAVDRVYIAHMSVLYDIEIIFRTAFAILAILAGRVKFAAPKELAKLESGHNQQDAVSA